MDFLNTQRSLTFLDQITHQSVLGLIHNIKADTVENSESPLTILFSSPGGSTGDGVFLHNFLRAQKREVRMVASCSVSSAGVYPFLAGEKRYALPGTTFFIHALSMELRGNYSIAAVREKLTVMEADYRKGREVLDNRTTIPSDELDEWLISGRVLTTEEAIHYGIIHEVIEID